jgi:hypothetical protein
MEIGTETHRDCADQFLTDRRLVTDMRSTWISILRVSGWQPQIIGTNQEEELCRRMEIGTETHRDCADQFLTDRRLVTVIFFVDETFVQIDGLDSWPWIAHEPAMDARDWPSTCLS